MSDPTVISPPATYVVRDGDTPSRISAAVYSGNVSLWRQLLDFNGIRDPRVLTAGMILVIPHA